MNRNLMISVLMVVGILMFSMPRVQAEDPAARAFDPMRICYEREGQNIKLEAEVLRLNGELTRVEAMAQGKIDALEDEIKYLRQALENIRSQVGGGGYEPKKTTTEPYNYVE